MILLTLLVALQRTPFLLIIPAAVDPSARERVRPRNGIEVTEAIRPNRQARRRRGKSDPADAIAAALAVLNGGIRVAEVQ